MSPVVETSPEIQVPPHVVISREYNAVFCAVQVVQRSLPSPGFKKCKLSATSAKPCALWAGWPICGTNLCDAFLHLTHGPDLPGISPCVCVALGCWQFRALPRTFTSCWEERTLQLSVPWWLIWWVSETLKGSKQRVSCCCSYLSAVWKMEPRAMLHAHRT